MASPKSSGKVENAHHHNVWCVAFSDNDKILTGSLDGTLKYWRKSLGKAIGTTDPPQRVGVTSIITSKQGANDGQYIAAACYQDSTIRFYKLFEDSIKPITVRDSKGRDVPDVFSPGLLEAWSISLAPDNATFATGANNGSVSLWSLAADDDTRKHDQFFTFETNGRAILSTAFRPTNSSEAVIACGAADGTVFVYDVIKSENVHTLQLHSLPARCIKFSPDGHLIYSASDDRHVSVFDSRSGTVVNSFSHSGLALTVDPSPDHRHFVVGSSDGLVSLWDLGMQRVETSYHCHADQVWGVAYDPLDLTGRRFASVGDDALLQLYE